MMKTQFKASFLRSIKKIESNQLKTEIANAIDNVEAAQNLKQIINLKKLKGYKQYFRIRIGDYRIGLKLDDQTLVFVDIGHRKNIYLIFP